MQNYFENEIKRLENELLYLKSSMKKTAGVIGLYRQYIEVPMVLEDDGGVVPYKITFYKVVANSIDQLFFVTIDEYYGDNLAPGNTRYGQVRYKYVQTRIQNNQLLLRLVARGTYDDQATIEGGGTVNLPIKMTVYSTDEFSLEPV